MKLRGGQLLARALQEKGVTQVFTLSGGFCNPALEGFMDCGIAVINAPSEQVAGHLADAHTRITRNPAVCLVGPEGFAGAVAAMMEAWGERSPIIFVTGSSTLKRQGSGGFSKLLRGIELCETNLLAASQLEDVYLQAEIDEVVTRTEEIPVGVVRRTYTLVDAIADLLKLFAPPTLDTNHLGWGTKAQVGCIE